MRETNRSVVLENDRLNKIVVSMQEIEAFFDDFVYLVFDRCYILCNDKGLSLNDVFRSLQFTLTNVIECCKCFCISDANVLLRKFRDDLFFCLYVILYNEINHDDYVLLRQKMEKIIDKWMKNELKKFFFSEVLKTISEVEYLKDPIDKYNLKTNFDKIR